MSYCKLNRMHVHSELCSHCTDYKAKRGHCKYEVLPVDLNERQRKQNELHDKVSLAATIIGSIIVIMAFILAILGKFDCS